MIVSRQTVACARVLMAAGASMTEAAEILGIIPSSELDLALWRWIGVPTDQMFASAEPQRKTPPEPMF